ncbi:hypothetical protein THRCLA_05588 [Thraustotheca clavata]|uniref:Uncharacterized protein n=1 Tax=Thraustotheca clavata TaxID=74557 RepID=A0A1V9ZVE9_9STRA|nr:hypothetical protein THRCLA_05588 [Thraustotheca clavata]
MIAPKCAQNMEQRLAALRRDQEIDGLRVYLIKYNLFPRNRDPRNSPIRIEELKELVKHWKLHRQRGFWRDHPEKDDLVRALLQHIKTEAANKKRRQDAQDKFRKINEIDEHQQESAQEEDGKPMQMLAETAQTSNGDLFYTRGNYDEGLIYLSRMDKSKQRQKLLNSASDTSLKTTTNVQHLTKGLLANVEHEKDVSTNFSKDMKVKCAEGLYNVSCYHNNEMQMLAENAIPIIAGLIKNPPTIDDTHIRLYCAAALQNLAMSHQARDLMMEQGAISTILELAHTNNGTTKLFCAHALYRFTGDEEAHVRLVHEGCVLVLLQLMSLPNEEIKELAMKSLINLSAVPRSTSSDTVMSALISLVKLDRPESNMVCARGLLNMSIMATTRANIVEDGAILALKILCSYRNVQVCQLASCVVCNLAALRANQDNMIKNGALLVIMELFNLPQFHRKQTSPETQNTFDYTRFYAKKAKLLDPNYIGDLAFTDDENAMLEIHMQCAITLAYFSCNSKLQPRVVGAGFVPRLLALLGMRHEETTKYITLSLSNFASHESCRVQMVREGAVRPLITLMSAPYADMLVKQDCVVTLCNLMLHPETYKEMVDDGVVPALVAYSEDNHPEIQKSCAFALLSLTMDTSMKPKLVQQGVITALISLADRCAQRPELRAACLCALYHISTDVQSAQALYYEGTQFLAVAVLNEPLNDKQPNISHRMYMHSLALLSNMASYEKERNALVDDGAVDAVLRFLQANSTVKDKVSAQYLARAQAYASSLLCKLSEVAMEHPGYFSALLVLASSANITPNSSNRNDVTGIITTLRCALAFANMSCSMKGRRLMGKHGEVAIGLNAMMRTGHHETQICAAIGLCNLAIERGPLKGQVWADNTVSDFIVVALLRVNSDTTKVICAKVLFNLLAHDDTREKLIVDGALYALIKLAKLDMEEIRQLCLRSIYNISLDLGKVQRLVEMEIVRILCGMHQQDYSKDMKRLICGILSNLSSVPGHELQMINEGALTIISTLVKVRDPESRVYCSNVLSNLSCNPDVLELLLKDEGNVIGILISLTRAESKDIRRYSAGAISNLSTVSMGIEIMTREGMINAMCELLQRLSCDTTLALCVRALRNLMQEQENQIKLVKCHGVQILSVLMATTAATADERNTASPAERAEIGKWCAELLCLLCRNPGVELQLVQDGIIRALNSIAKHQSEHARSLTPSSQQKPSKEALESLNASRIDIISCFSILSKDPNCHEQMLKDGVMEAIVSMAMDADDESATLQTVISRLSEEFCYHCMICLRNLTGSKEGTFIKEDTQTVVNIHDVNRARVSSQAHAIAIIIAMASSSVGETREHVVVTLYNLSCHRRSRGLIIANDGIKVLIRLAQNAAGPNAPLKRHICSIALQAISTHQDVNIMQPGLIEAMTACLAELGGATPAAPLPESAIQRITMVMAPTMFIKPKTVSTLLPPSNVVLHHHSALADWTQVTSAVMIQDMINDLFAQEQSVEDAQQATEKAQVIATSAPRACNFDAVLGSLVFLKETVLAKNKALLGPHSPELFGLGRVSQSTADLAGLPQVSAPRPISAPEKDELEAPRSSAAQARKEASKSIPPLSPSSPMKSPSKKQQTRLEPIPL